MQRKLLGFVIVCCLMLIGLASTGFAAQYLACDSPPVTMQSVEVRVDGVVYQVLKSADQPAGQSDYLLYDVSGLTTWTLHTMTARWSDVAGATGGEWSPWAAPFAHTERGAPGGLRIVEN